MKKQPDLRELFQHLHDAIDIFDRLLSHLILTRASTLHETENAIPTAKEKGNEANLKQAWTFTEVCENTGVGRSLIYKAMSSKELRAVKCRLVARLILTKALDALGWQRCQRGCWSQARPSCRMYVRETNAIRPGARGDG